MATAVAMPISLSPAIGGSSSRHRYDKSSLPPMHHRNVNVVKIDVIEDAADAAPSRSQNVHDLPRTPLSRSKTSVNNVKPSSRAQSAWLAPGIDRAPREPGMDASQRAVLRRWKLEIGEHVTVSEELLYEMQEAGLVPEDVVKMIKVERMNKAKVYRLLDAVRACELPTSFNVFCAVLAKFYPVMAQNIVAELEIERGHVTVDPDLKHDTETLVHRRFGGNKRFCELDKKDIAELFGWKLQVCRAEAKRERERLVEALKAEKAKNAAATARCKEMAATLDEFTTRHRKRVVTHAHDMQTPGDVLATMAEGDGVVARLQAQLSKMLERIDMMVTEDEKLRTERQQCLAYMKITDSGSNGVAKMGEDKVRLDVALSRYVTAALGKLEAEIREKETTIARLHIMQHSQSQSSSGDDEASAAVQK